MRYLPLTDADRRDDAGGHRRRQRRCAVPRRAARGAAGAAGRSAARHGRARSRARAVAHGGEELAAGAVPSFLGAGVYRHHVPAAVDHLIQRGEFLTSYTPYQPEIAQGTLQALFEFQTQVALITGMEVANASMYDGATACAEAVMMANRVTRRHKAILAGGLHPHYRETTATHARFAGFAAVARAARSGGARGSGAR